MKKILLATSALVAMSSVAVAGDIPAAPMAPMVAGFTVVATGSATIYGWFNGTGAGTYGISGKYEGKIKASKTLDNGADVYAALEFTNTAAVKGTIGYNSAVGNFAAGYQDLDAHGVSEPGAPGIPNIGDELEDGDKGLTFAGAFIGDATVALSNYAPWTAGAPLIGTPVRVTYVSPEFGGFKLGAGIDSASAYDTAIAGSFDVSGATVKVGVAFAGPATATMSTTGKVGAGASVEIAGFTLGGKATYTLAGGAGATAFEVGAAYATGPFTVSAKYNATDTTAGTGIITAGARYNENGLDLIVDGTYSLAAGNAYTVAAGAIYAFTADVTVGATVGYNGTTVLASAGVDYDLNSNVLIGAGVGYDGANFGAAAGLKVSF
uniref:Porin domain-containing protein n=1 Tax=OCS116 cluster bacterium TaxID=2030921 RepID=A0A2A4YTT3_9PROT